MRVETTAYSAPQGDRNDCSVRALSIAANMPYADAHRLFALAGRRDGRRTPVFVTAGIHERLGYTRIPTVGSTHYGTQMTVAQFLRAHPRGRYVLHRRSHAFAVVDGVVHDWASGTGTRSRVQRAWLVSLELK